MLAECMNDLNTIENNDVAKNGQLECYVPEKPFII